MRRLRTTESIIDSYDPVVPKQRGCVKKGLTFRDE
jgi:hypothetical protein